MYELYYKFTAEPFRLSPDHRFCFEHKSYGKARAYMAYAFKRAEGFVMITGRPGTGKTTLIGELVESLSREKVVTANLVCTQLQADDLLKTVAYSFGISPAQVGKAELLQRLNILLLRWHREGRRTLLVVDEAQDLSPSAMEELRLLTNIQFGGQPLLQIFLLGQPELRDLILSPEMEQVHQRIVAASHIEGLEADETEAYVIHRLSVVGWQGNPAIDRAIFPLIHRFSEGVPRRINLICSRLFLLGSVEERDVIGLADVRVVIGELQAENLAAGTGVSHADFHKHAETQWAPVPVNESQVSPLPHLQTVNSTSVVAADESSAEQTVEAKKKDIPSLDSLVKPVPHSEPEVFNDSVAGLEFVSEDDPVADESIYDELVESKDALYTPDTPDTPDEYTPDEYTPDEYTPDQYSPEDSGTSLATNSGAALASAAPRRRLIVSMFLILVTAAVVVLLKSCFVTQDSWSLLEPGTADGGQHVVETVVSGERVGAVANANEPSAPSSRHGVAPEPGIPTTLTGIQVKAAVTVDRAPGSPRPKGAEKPATSLSVPATHILEEPQGLMPIVVEARRLQMPVATAAAMEDVSPGESPQDASPVGPLETVGQDTSSSANGDVVPANTAVQPDWPETISISFAFDSDDLISDSHLALDKAATMLRENTSSVASITGFTDNRGDSQYNLVLSRKRADAVERYLVDAGIARERLLVEGRGVLTDPIEAQASGSEDAMEPYRIVRITVAGDE